MNIYLDSSALVKAFIAEPQSQEVLSLLGQAEIVASSVVALPETTAAIRRANNAGQLDPVEALRTRAQFVEHWDEIVALQLDEFVLQRSVELVWAYSLRGFDAVHLASAIELQRRATEPLVFATFDRVLWRAARESGLDAWPPDFA
jgi:uncharacterized protein